MAIKLPNRRLVSQEDQSMIQRPDIPRSRFIGAKTRKTTFDAGYLVPFLVDEILPGDHMTYDVTAYLRMATPLFPIFDNQRIDTFFFFVPNRILWENWQKMMGEQDEPDSPIDYEIPQVTPADADDWASGTIFDHMGLPLGNGVTPGPAVNALPLRAYNLIYNEWFRDQNLQDKLIINKGDSGDLQTDFNLMRRAKSHDYFTSALPWPQKFTPPTIAVGGLAPVKGIGAVDLNAGTWGSVTNVYETGTPPLGPGVDYAVGKLFHDPSTVNILVAKQGPELSPGSNIYPLEIYADLAEATGLTINNLRQAWLVQTLLERDARGGTRYTEIIKSHFGVTSPDARLQRPEYIGGGQSPLNVTPIAQTAPTTGATVGALGAAATSTGQHRASYAATEHGYIIGLINVRTELSYQQGLHKMWSRRTRYDFYWPALAGLGEQAILNQEIFYEGISEQDEAAFGYQERWHEYRTMYSDVTGQFRSTVAGTLDAWHLAQEFASLPLLGDLFIQDIPPMSRILAAGELAVNQQYLADIMIQRAAVRPMPLYGTPISIGRF